MIRSFLVFVDSSYQVIANSTRAGSSGLPISGFASSIAARRSISSAVRSKPAEPRFSSMRSSWTDFGITATPLCMRKRSATWAGVLPWASAIWSRFKGGAGMDRLLRPLRACWNGFRQLVPPSGSEGSGARGPLASDWNLWTTRNALKRSARSLKPRRVTHSLAVPPRVACSNRPEWPLPCPRAAKGRSRP